jgi:hypothetical protein
MKFLLNNKSKLYYLIFIIVPLLLFLSTFQTITKKSYNWYGGDYDPAYAYLFNSLNNTILKQAGHVDHPGTPVQIAGALVLRTYHFFDITNKEDIQVSVLTNPEKYLSILTWFFATLNCIILFLAGCLVFRKVVSIWPAVFLQFTPFLSPMILTHGMIRFSQEIFLYLSVFIFILTIYLFFKGKIKANTFVYLIAAISGFGISCKITFFPIVLLPLIMVPAIKDKLKYVLFTAISFILFTIPICNKYDIVFKWVKALLFHTGQYGSGETGIIDKSEYLMNFIHVLLYNPVFLVILILGIISVFLIRISRNYIELKNHFKLSVAVLMTQFLGVIMVAKHPSERYLLPFEVLSGLQVLIIFDFFTSKFKRSLQQFIFSVFFLLFLCLCAFKSYHVKASFYSNERNNEFLSSYNQFKKLSIKGIRIFCLPSSSVESALYFGSVFSSAVHSPKLAEIYPDTYFVIPSEMIFKRWNGSNISFDELVKKQNKEIYFLTLTNWANFTDQSKEKLIKEGYKLEDKLKGKNQTIYQLVKIPGVN